MSGSPYGSPTKRERNNVNYGSPSSKLKISSDVNSHYLNFLRENIPILNDTKLWELIMNYVNAINGITRDKVTVCIDKINEYLKTLHNNAVNFNITKMNSLKNNIVYKDNLGILKKHSINAKSLIEAIIQLTLYYNDSSVTVVSSLYKTKGSLYQRMNFIENKTLKNSIYEIYESDMTDFEKNNTVLNILIAIANKLNYLQEKCGFIHGDFHSDNIFINEETGPIQFIDFGYSYIHLPGTTLTIFVPIDENINGALYKISEMDQSKSADLFRLIESFRYTTIPLFESLIRQISERYFRNFDELIYSGFPNRKTPNLSRFRELPIPFSRSRDFLYEKKNQAIPSSFIYVCPLEFVKFILDENRELHHELDSVFYKKNNR